MSNWPKPKYDENIQPHFVFLITPPFSGSTAIAKLMSSSPYIAALNEEGEGQWLVPGLQQPDRWEKDKVVDYSSVKAVWLSQFQALKTTSPQLEVVIEKSPPNMKRLTNLSKQFERVSFLANNRNPYSCCASMLNRTKSSMDNEPGSQEVLGILSEKARAWLDRSWCVKELIEKLQIPLVTYESFCQSRANLIDKLALPDYITESIDTEASVKVKDYAAQPIKDQNPRQIASLNESEIAFLSNIFKQHKALLSFFGYSLIT